MEKAGPCRELLAIWQGDASLCYNDYMNYGRMYQLISLRTKKVLTISW